MKDLRKKILMESGKTVSRKARARPDNNWSPAQHSPVSSAPHSRAGSRVPSRVVSEEEDGNSDANDSLTNSAVAFDETDETNNNIIKDWTDLLKDCISEIVDRKRSSTQGREKCFAAYTHLTRHHFAGNLIQTDQLVRASLTSIKSDRKTDETVAALKALIMTIISTDSDRVYNVVYSPLKSLAEHSAEESVKVEAINAMAVAVAFGGGAEIAVADTMSFLFEVIESDGGSVEAVDNGPVVTAALQAWGLLASGLDDLQDKSEEAIEAFTDQLDSIDVGVLLAAGTNLALIFEVIRQHEHQSQENHEAEQEALMEAAKAKREEFNYEAYTPFTTQHAKYKLQQRATELANESSKAVSKKDRQELHKRFNSILTSLELDKGPGYSKAGRIARESDRDGARVYDREKVFAEFGYRETIKDQKMTLTIDSWSLSIRVAFLKKVLGGGFSTHWATNPAVQGYFDGA